MSDRTKNHVLLILGIVTALVTVCIQLLSVGELKGKVETVIGQHESRIGGIDVYVELALKVGVAYYPISPLIGPFTASYVPLAGAMFDEWINGRAGASLSARMVENDGSPAITIPAGGTLTVWAVAEQV